MRKLLALICTLFSLLSTRMNPGIVVLLCWLLAVWDWLYVLLNGLFPLGITCDSNKMRTQEIPIFLPLWSMTMWMAGKVKLNCMYFLNPWLQTTVLYVVIIAVWLTGWERHGPAAVLCCTRMAFVCGCFQCHIPEISVVKLSFLSLWLCHGFKGKEILKTSLPLWKSKTCLTGLTL